MEIEINNMRIDIWPVALFVLIGLLIRIWSRKHNLPNLICSAIFGVYLLFAAKEVFFPLAINGNYVDVMRQVPFMSHVNLVPFYFGEFFSMEEYLPGIIGNIILTMPFGFGLSFVVPIKAKAIFGIAVGVGFGIEAIQLIISLLLGYPYRVIDVNDALLNACGVLLGFGLFRIFTWLYLSALSSTIDKEHGGLPAYIDKIARQA